MIKGQLNDIPGKINNDVNSFDGGLNVCLDKAFINNNQMPFAINVGMYTPPRLTTRPSRTSLAEMYEFSDFIDYEQLFNMNVVGMYQYFNDTYVVIDLGGGEGRLAVITIFPTDKKYIVDWNIIIDLPVSDHIYFCECSTSTVKELYIMNETFKAKINLETHEARQINDDHYGIPCYHKGRLFIADPLTNIVTYSCLRDFDNFNGDTNEILDEIEELQNVSPQTDTTRERIRLLTLDIDYSSYSGDFYINNAKGRATALVSYDNKMFIFCEESIQVMYGDSPYDSYAGTSYFQLVDFNNDLGTISQNTVALGDGCLFWVGNDGEIYRYDGSYKYMLSKPINSRYYESLGGVSGLIVPGLLIGTEKLIATSKDLYFNFSSINSRGVNNDLLVKYNFYTKNWMCEDGEFTDIAVYDNASSAIIVRTLSGDIQVENPYFQKDFTDLVYNGTSVETVPIKYEFQTKIYGAEGVDTRKTIADVWLQARANANVYISDRWTSEDLWRTNKAERTKGMVHIGELKDLFQEASTEVYRATTYEQQRLILPKMYGERLNAFSIYVSGEGRAEFYLMKRDWRIS